MAFSSTPTKRRCSKMNRVGLVSLIVVFSALTIFFLREAPSLRAQAQPYQPLEGTLFKGRIEALEKADVPLPSTPRTAPALWVFIRDPRQVGLAADATEFVGKIVPEADAKAVVAPFVKSAWRSKGH